LSRLQQLSQTDFFHHHSHAVKLLLDSSPVDNAWSDDVVQLEDNQAVGKVIVEMMYKRRHSQTVHPVAVHCNAIQIITSTAPHLWYNTGTSSLTDSASKKNKPLTTLASHNALHAMTGKVSVILMFESITFKIPEVLFRPYLVLLLTYDLLTLKI